MMRRLLVLFSLFSFILSASAALATSYSEFEPNDSMSSAQAFASSDGAISVLNAYLEGNYSDYFSFYGTAGDIINISMDAIGGTTCCYKDPILYLYSSTGFLLSYNDDGGGFYNALINNYTLTASDWFIVLANDYGIYNSAYNYNLNISGLTPYNSEPVPEPSTLLLLTMGLVGLGLYTKKRKF